MDHITIQHDLLRQFGAALLIGAGVPRSTAELVADSLVASNLRAVDSHGVQLLGFYIDQIRAGNFDVHARGRVASELGGSMTYDSENGIGQLTASICSDHAIRLARDNGVGIVTARECNHFGAAAYWAHRISRAGLMSMVVCNASPLVPPWQGKETRFGTNPICVSVPGPNTWLLDMATTTVAMGKIYKASLSGVETIPAGWAMDSEGVPTTQTAAAMQGGLLMPLGGYKGSGLAFLVEILCAVLSGGAMSTEVGGLRLQGRPMRVSHFFMGIDIERFMPVETFIERMQSLVETVKQTKTAKGYEEVLVAGEPEWRAEELRRREGIPLDAGVWQHLSEAAESLGVMVPLVQ
ncbi:MAG TPA: Ldh family oxidoreductase [Bryobacteraceae bacterium]|jgi:LDH2 family malate/lactate/ureidoglycolate dehydrogenase